MFRRYEAALPASTEILLTTPPGLFFEIVQRSGSYRGYGVPNAPFRIAAQKRMARPAGMPRI